MVHAFPSNDSDSLLDSPTPHLRDAHVRTSKPLDRRQLTILQVDLRDPPTDPRKARRHCLNLGFSREDNSESTTSPVSSSSSPGLAYDSESDRSSLQDIEMEFPQPPSITTPQLRRMESAPSFADTQHLFRHDIALNSRFSQPPPRRAKHMSESASSPAASTHHHSFYAPDGRVNGLSKRFEACSPATPRASKRESVVRHPPTTPRRASVYYTPAPAPVPVTTQDSARTVHKMRSLKFHCSLDSPVRAPQDTKLKPIRRSLLKGRSVSMEFTSQGHSASSRSVFMKGAGGYRSPHLSAAEPRARPRPQTTHFRHEKDGLSSFMDITPERKKPVKETGANRDRVRRLWMKASKGIVEWLGSRK